ncbi:hypothetical protein [Campylobacter sp. RM12651]|uniref:hypothetical protein n=1 Tax=Campylobacter sp. RM12651 TaxID=1660079 RepID=UPI001EFBED37|nr:hypothetical protein [Campylobacter sp. RM12651]ULO03762.1 hypothetical protein AVBRAN_1308 [Campylobacter sp. RM12651]
MYIKKKIALAIIIASIIMNITCIIILSLPNVFPKASDPQFQQEYIVGIFYLAL